MKKIFVVVTSFIWIEERLLKYDEMILSVIFLYNIFINVICYNLIAWELLSTNNNININSKKGKKKKIEDYIEFV